MAEYIMPKFEPQFDEQLTLMPDKIFMDFIEFHEKHPKVYQTLRKMAFEWHEAGNGKLGIGMLFEVMRWNESLRPDKDPDAKFALNNNFRSHYARLLMFNEPDLRNLFEIRQLRSI
jgi:hypothetical protein